MSEETGRVINEESHPRTHRRVETVYLKGNIFTRSAKFLFKLIVTLLVIIGCVEVFFLLAYRFADQAPGLFRWIIKLLDVIINIP